MRRTIARRRDDDPPTRRDSRSRATRFTATYGDAIATAQHDDPLRRTSCTTSRHDDAIPFDSLLADASRVTRTHSLDAIRAPKIEDAMSHRP
jgi:hypothetical protein